MRNVLVALAILSGAATSALGDDRVAVQDGVLVLLSDRGACRLVQLGAATDTVMRLPLSGLCTFHRDDAGTLRMMNTDAGPVFLIETSNLQTGSTQDCDTQVLAVRLTTEGLVMAPVASRVATCLPFQWDDATFLGAF